MSSAYQRLLVTASAFASKRPRSPLWAVIFILGALIFAGIPDARAAFVTTQEEGVDGVYSQGTFDGDNVDIVFGSTVTLINGDLLSIDNEARLNTLFSFNDASEFDDVIFIYFVDDISWCGAPSDPGTSFVGCASLEGNDIVVDSVFASGGDGTELIAHEIGHSLGLDHTTIFSIFANLMDPAINGNTSLLMSQVTDILNSPFIQMMGDSSRFINITPVLIVTPLPPAGIMFISAILVLFGVQRRKKLGV